MIRLEDGRTLRLESIDATEFVPDQAGQGSESGTSEADVGSLWGVHRSGIGLRLLRGTRSEADALQEQILHTQGAVAISGTVDGHMTVSGSVTTVSADPAPAEGL